MFQINEKLSKKILEHIPDDYTPRQKIIAVYKNLCETLDYSMAYYIDEAIHYRDFANPDNLKFVDGENNADIVCYTFSAIMYEIVDQMNLSGVEPIPPELTIDDWFDSEHACFHCKIDGDLYEFDSLDGVISRNDMIATKYNEPLTGIKLLDTEKVGSSKSKLKKGLESDIYEVCSQDIKLCDLAQKYQSIKGNNYFEISLQDRYELFKSMIMDVKGKITITKLNYIIRLKHLLFKPTENTTYFDAQFLNDASKENKRIFIFFNPKGYRNIEGKENFDYLEISEYKPEDQTFVSYTREELLEIENSKNFASRIQGVGILNYCRMIKKGVKKNSEVVESGN